MDQKHDKHHFYIDLYVTCIDQEHISRCKIFKQNMHKKEHEMVKQNKRTHHMDSNLKVVVGLQSASEDRLVNATHASLLLILGKCALFIHMILLLQASLPSYRNNPLYTMAFVECML